MTDASPDMLPPDERVELAQSRGGQRAGGRRAGNRSESAPPATTEPVTVRNQVRRIPSQYAEDVQNAAERLEQALRRVRNLDPSWSLPPGIRSTGDVPLEQVQGLLRSLLDGAQIAEARATVIERGGVPLAFRTREEFQSFGQAVKRSLRDSGYQDAQAYLRGSSVTGYNYVTGRPFDEGRLSDLDIAIVSPRAFERARELGVRIRGGGRTEQLDRGMDESLGFSALVREGQKSTGRDATIMIYRSLKDLETRGPFSPID